MIVKEHAIHVLVVAVILLAYIPSPAMADIVGIPSVTDGDTIEIHGTRIRLHGIDAPESGQLCQRGGESWHCGQKAAHALDDLIAKRPVTCAEKGTDRYGRVIGVCAVAGVNVNGWMVANGWALAYRTYSTDYVEQENDARKHAVGLWSGQFVPPWDHRKAPKAVSTLRSDSEASTCTIKGNISSRGDRIYHVPGSRWYDATRIDESKGERWFCSESVARQAGWRKAGMR